jgi:restriction system protein
MAVPKYEDLMEPLLGALMDGEPRSMKDLRAELAQRLDLTEEDLSENIPSGAGVFANRLHWAATYMAQAGLVTRPRRGFSQITQRGQESFESRGRDIDNTYFREFQEFREFKSRVHPTRRPTPSPLDLDSVDEMTPLEAIEALVGEANATLASELLQRVLAQDPAFMEELVLQVLTRMGYGGGAHGTAERLGRSGDEGIDGVISRTRSGLSGSMCKRSDTPWTARSVVPTSKPSLERCMASRPNGASSSPPAASPQMRVSTPSG